MKQLILVIATVILVCSCNKKEHGYNFLFDMTPELVKAESGYMQVTPVTSYDSAIGYGWVHSRPNGVFYRKGGKLQDSILETGVKGKDSLVFRADIPDGDYYITITLGNTDSIPMKMLVSVNDEVLPDTVIAPWYRLAYRTVRHKFHIKGSRAQIGVRGVGTDVGVFAVEIRPVASPEKNISGNTIEQDTAVIQKIHWELLDRFINDPTNTALGNQIDLIQKYLVACSYYDGGGWSWTQQSTGYSLIYRMYAAADLLEQIVVDKDDPLYERATYLLARIYYWLDKEDSNPSHERKAKELFTSLQEKYPGNKIISMYLGKRILNDNDTASLKSSTAPAWAVYQHEAMHRMLGLIHWWVTEKQEPNGELGGKYGDDVEILRWWLPAVLGADDSLAKLGYERLADGVWNSGILERGFAKRVDDVEHSAELFRDTHPGMFLVKYGDPEYVERSLISMQNFRDVWTGITSLGHRHFRSYYLSATEVVPQHPYGVDVALNARALLPGLWATWYNNNPSLLQLFNEWGRAWVEDAARASNGKPAGVLPSAVAFEGDKIGGDSKQWYDPKLTYDYYNWDHMGHVNELQYHLLGMYKITGNDLFLKTVDFCKRALFSAKEHPQSVKETTPGSIEWVKQQILSGGTDRDPNQHPMAKLFAMAKDLTGKTAYDSLLQEYGAPYNRYVIDRDTSVIIAGLKNILEILRYNSPLLTSEVKFTDRVYVTGSNILMGMYTGHFGAGYEFPSLPVSWKNTGKDVAVFVQHGDDKSIRTALYNFGKEKIIGMRTWQLTPGVYTVKVSEDRNNDGIADAVLSSRNVELKERVNDLAMNIPSGKNLILEVTQISSFKETAGPKPDLALDPGAIRLERSGTGLQVTVPVHNIGNAMAREIKVLLFLDDQQVQSAGLPLLQAPNDLVPQLKPVIFLLKPLAGRHRVRIEVMNPAPEITSLNNRAEGVITSTDAELSVSF